MNHMPYPILPCLPLSQSCIAKSMKLFVPCVESHYHSKICELSSYICEYENLECQLGSVYLSDSNELEWLNACMFIYSWF